MKTAHSSSSPTTNSSAKPRLIQVVIPNWVIEEAGLSISALIVEISGAEWSLLIHTKGPNHSRRSVKLPARDIKINGRGLDHFLNAVAAML